MARVSVSHGLGDLKRDLSRIPAAFYREGREIVTEGAKVGNTLAKDDARRTAGRHGKHYPKAFTADRATSYTGPVGKILAEYGPDSSRPQGDMDFEFGSGRQTRPHLNLAKSADVIGLALYGETRRMLDGFFWPGGDR